MARSFSIPSGRPPTTGWTRRYFVPPRRRPLSRVRTPGWLARLILVGYGYGRIGQMECGTTSLTGAIGRYRWPRPRLGGISSPEAIGWQRERPVYAKPFLTPGSFPLARGRPFFEDACHRRLVSITPRPLLLLWQRPCRFGSCLRG